MDLVVLLLIVTLLVEQDIQMAHIKILNYSILAQPHGMVQLQKLQYQVVQSQTLMLLMVVQVMVLKN